MGIAEGQVSSFVFAEEPESAEDKPEMITLSSNKVKEDGELGETSMVEGDAVNTVVVTVPMSTSSLAAGFTAAFQSPASCTGNMTAPEAIANIQQLLKDQYYVVSSIIGEAAHEVILIAQSMKNTAQAMESMTEDDQTNDTAEEMVNMWKTKSGLPKIHKCPKCKRRF